MINQRKFCLGLVLYGLLVYGTALSSSSAQARTWNVTKLGNGDFLVIQDAVNAAADGDTILIGSGRYEDFTWYQLGGELHYVFCDKSLTFIGSGPDQTIIGHEDPDYIAENVRQEGIVCVTAGATIRVRNIGFENLRNGRCIAVEISRLTVSNCAFRHSSNGIVGIIYNGGIIQNSIFINIGTWPSGTSGGAIEFLQPTNSFIISNCELRDCFVGVGAYWPGTTGIEVLDCSFIGGRAATNFVDWAQGAVRRCTMEGQDTWGIAASGGAIIDIEDNIIIANHPNQEAAGFGTFFPDGEFTFRRNIISASGGNTCLELTMPGNIIDARDNHFICLDDSSTFGTAEALYDSLGPYPIDLTGNWWGTTDPDEISAKLLDLHDDPDRRCEFIFEPFLTEGVPSKRKSMGSVKALFR